MAIDPKAWADTFAKALVISGEHVPLERVIARHRKELDELRRLGLTWQGVASLLVRAGARRANTKLISADQLRVSYARLSRGAGNDNAPANRAPRGRKPARAPATDPPLKVATLDEPAQEDDLFKNEQRPLGKEARQTTPLPKEDQDVSAPELEAVLARLNSLKPEGNSK